MFSDTNTSGLQVLLITGTYVRLILTLAYSIRIIQVLVTVVSVNRLVNSFSYVSVVLVCLLTMLSVPFSLVVFRNLLLQPSPSHYSDAMFVVVLLLLVVFCLRKLASVVTNSNLLLDQLQILVKVLLFSLKSIDIQLYWLLSVVYAASYQHL